MIFELLKQRGATSPASATVSERMADVDSASCCIFSQTVRDRPRGTTWSHSSISCRKTFRGMWRSHDHRRDSCDHCRASLPPVAASKDRLFSGPAHDSCLSIDIHGGRKTAG